MRNTDHSIVLADENDATRAFLTSNLEADGYRVKAADDRATAIALLSVDQPDLIIADINGQTLELLDAIRSGNGLAGHLDPDTPMIVLSERPDHIHRIRVLDGVATTSSPSPSHIRSCGPAWPLCCAAPNAAAITAAPVASLTIDLTARHVRLGDDPIALSAKEYELLVALAHDPHRVFTREELLRNVWGYRTPSRTVDSHAVIETEAVNAPERLIINVWARLPPMRPRRLAASKRDRQVR